MSDKKLTRRQFASDNYAGVCPAGWKAMEMANQGHSIPYGDDDLTEQACNAIRDLFETRCEVFFVFNGTAANSLSLASLCQSYHSVICHRNAHIETDECGAPEFFSNGTKILLAEGDDGRIDVGSAEALIKKRADIHYPKPKVLSLTQATEHGTVYTPDQVASLGDLARSHGLSVHMDGARFANAVASLNCAPSEITWKAGIDVLCFGGTKNGLPIGDAVVFFNQDLAREFEFRCKQAGQLASKMRFISAPWIGLLESDTWLANAAHANKCARLLAREIATVDGVKILYPVEANAVFVSMEVSVTSSLHQLGWRFYTFIGMGGARLMCGWDTTEEDVLALAADIKKLCSAH